MFGKFVRELEPLEKLQGAIEQEKNKQSRSQITAETFAKTLNESEYFGFPKSQGDEFLVCKKEERIPRGFFGTYTSTTWEVDLYTLFENKKIFIGTVYFTDSEDKNLGDGFFSWIWGGFTVSFSNEIVKKMVEKKQSFHELLPPGSSKVKEFSEQYASTTEIIESYYADKKSLPEYVEISQLFKDILKNPKNSALFSFDVDKLLGGRKKDSRETLLFCLTIAGGVLFLAGIIAMAAISPSSASEWAGLGPSLFLHGVMLLIARLCFIGFDSSNSRTSAAQAVKNLLEKAEDLSQEEAELFQLTHSAKPEDTPQAIGSTDNFTAIFTPDGSKPSKNIQVDGSESLLSPQN